MLEFKIKLPSTHLLAIFVVKQSRIEEKKTTPE